MTYLLPGLDSMQDLDMELIFFPPGNRVSFANNSDLKFAFNISGTELAADTTDIELNHTFIFEDGSEITAYRYTRSPLLDKISIKCEDDFNYDLILEGEDNLGNPVSFYLSSKHGGEITLEEFITESDNVSTEVSTEAKSLTLTLYAVKFPEQSGKLSNDFQQVGESFTIEIK